MAPQGGAFLSKSAVGLRLQPDLDQPADGLALDSGGPRLLAMEFDVALFGDRRLLNSDHLPLHLSELCSRLLVATDKECCWPEDHDGGSRRHRVFGALAVLRARERCGPCRNGLSFECELLAV